MSQWSHQASSECRPRISRFRRYIQDRCRSPLHRLPAMSRLRHELRRWARKQRLKLKELSANAGASWHSPLPVDRSVEQTLPIPRHSDRDRHFSRDTIVRFTTARHPPNWGGGGGDCSPMPASRHNKMSWFALPIPKSTYRRFRCQSTVCREIASFTATSFRGCPSTNNVRMRRNAGLRAVSLLSKATCSLRLEKSVMRSSPALHGYSEYSHCTRDKLRTAARMHTAQTLWLAHLPCV